MANAERRTGGASQSQAPTRLQRRAPATLQINRPSDWNLAIPLLSPLVSPSCCSEQMDVAAAVKKGREMETAVSFTKWQHPAAPFYYGTVPRTRPFVPV